MLSFVCGDRKKVRTLAVQLKSNKQQPVYMENIETETENEGDKDKEKEEAEEECKLCHESFKKSKWSHHCPKKQSQ
jgi:Zn finger protein HypA/HybF involved in hydrogenase expression